VRGKWGRWGKHLKHREFRFDEYARIWASIPAEVRHRVNEIIRDLLRAEFHRRRETKAVTRREE
jgi:hypothetical protein